MPLGLTQQGPFRAAPALGGKSAYVAHKGSNQCFPAQQQQQQQQYLGVLGDPVPEDVEHAVGGCPPDHKLLVAIPLVRGKDCKERRECG